MGEKRIKPAFKVTPGLELELGGLKIVPTVGEKRNYSLQPGDTEYQLWPISTIEWIGDENKYRARALIQHKKTRELVAFNSWHQDFADAERAIALVSDSLRGVGPRRLFNIFGQTIAVGTAHIGGPPVNSSEVLVLIWSMRSAN